LKGGRTRWHSVENSLWERIWTCRKRDHGIERLCHVIGRRFYTGIEMLLPRVIISIQNTFWAKNITKTMTSIKDVSICTGNNSLFAFRCAEMQYAEYSLPIIHVTHARTKRLKHTHTHMHTQIYVNISNVQFCNSYPYTSSEARWLKNMYKTFHV